MWDHPCDEYYRKLYDEEKQRRRVAKTQQENARAQRQAAGSMPSEAVDATSRSLHAEGIRQLLKPLGALGSDSASRRSRWRRSCQQQQGSQQSRRRCSSKVSSGAGKAAAEREEREREAKGTRSREATSATRPTAARHRSI